MLNTIQSKRTERCVFMTNNEDKSRFYLLVYIFASVFIAVGIYVDCKNRIITLNWRLSV